ncbi:MAG: Gldg family protein [Oscillospiraceae bacterium]|nr:Gldg family protein [Oscillospiraceae bacterium]
MDNFKAEIKNLFSSISSKKGSYSAGLTIVAIAIVVMLSLFTGLLPDELKQIDISDSGIYTIGDTTRGVLEALENNISFTVIAEPGTVDVRIEKIIDQYVDGSDKISLVEVDPVQSPAEVAALGGESGSVIVTNEDEGKSTTVLFDDMLVYDVYSYYYYGTTEPMEFDGEGRLTSAINYVTTERSERIYTTEGHGESALTSAVTERITQLSLSTTSLSLLLEGGVPEDCSVLILNGPTVDISEDEKAMLESYLSSGGGILYVAAYEHVSLPNLEALLADYGISVEDGYVADLERYYMDSPYYIFPVLSDSHEITSSLSADSLLLLIESQGFTLTDPARDTITVESFMTTSERGVAVTESGQVEGEYVLGATAIETLDGSTGMIAAISSISVMDENIIASFPSLVNADVFMNALTWFMDEVVDVSIPAKSLETSYNTVNGSFWGTVFVFIIPLAFIACGLVIWLRRRRA